MIATTGKKLAAIQARLKRKNREFARMTPAQQRVQVAKDVIRQLSTKQIVAKSSYLSSNEATNCAPDDMPACAALDQVQCEVCGIGSIFVAALKRADEMTMGRLRKGDMRNTQVRYLSQWFDRSQLNLIESYFEAHETPFRGHRPDRTSPIHIVARIAKTCWCCFTDDEWDLVKHAVRSRSRPSQNEALIMIMENIISNRGKFDPYRGAHRVTK